MLDYTGLTVLTFFLFLPGHIELHLILSPTKSAAIPRLNPITAAFVDPYTHRLGAPGNSQHWMSTGTCTCNIDNL